MLFFGTYYWQKEQKFEQDNLNYPCPNPTENPNGRACQANPSYGEPQRACQRGVCQIWKRDWYAQNKYINFCSQNWKIWRVCSWLIALAANSRKNAGYPKWDVTAQTINQEHFTWKYMYVYATLLRSTHSPSRGHAGSLLGERERSRAEPLLFFSKNALATAQMYLTSGSSKYRWDGI